MRYAVLMTVCNRESTLLANTLDALYAAAPAGTDVVIVNDGSTILLDRSRGRWFDADDYRAHRIAGSFNNPARAFNLALSHARGERCLILSSDTVVPPDLFARLDAHDLSSAAYTPRIVNMPGGQEYCGPSRVFPAPWCLAAMTEDVRATGWDEAYLAGQSYEDNDFLGRLMLRIGAFVGDWGSTAVHQAHPQPAYTAEAWAATQANREYTLRKWGAIPFYKCLCPLAIKAHRRDDGSVLYAVNGLDASRMAWARAAS